MLVEIPGLYEMLDQYYKGPQLSFLIIRLIAQLYEEDHIEVREQGAICYYLCRRLELEFPEVTESVINYLPPLSPAAIAYYFTRAFDTEEEQQLGYIQQLYLMCEAFVNEHGEQHKTVKNWLSPFKRTMLRQLKQNKEAKE